MDTQVVRTIKNNCYCDIAQGSILFMMFVVLQFAIYGLLPSSTIPILSVIPPAQLYSQLAPITQGDLILITLITGYGAVWGLRLISSAMDKLHRFRSINVSQNPLPLTQ